MEIGIGLPNQILGMAASAVPEWASQAEQAGFSALASVGRIAYPGVMDTVALAAAAGASSTIRLLSGIMIGPAWPPVLLAKEVAGIDAVSGNRLTLGLGLGGPGRPDDFVVDGLGPRGTGARLDHDLEVYQQVWRGQPLNGGLNPLVPAGTREVPLMFGGASPAAMARMARWGTGYLGGSLPPQMVAHSFDAARAAWSEAGRDGSPRLTGIAYFAVSDIDRGRQSVRHYYGYAGEEALAVLDSAICAGADAVRTVLKTYEDLGADEVILNPTLGDLDEVTRLADIVF